MFWSDDSFATQAIPARFGPWTEMATGMMRAVAPLTSVERRH
jgi:hypothetical protein